MTATVVTNPPIASKRLVIDPSYTLTTVNTLHESVGTRGRVVGVLLAGSLCCNVAGLVVPFLEIDVFLRGTSTYSLPHSVQLMWEARLYAIALLIVGFSILFPLAKLAVMTSVWFFMRDPGPRRALLEWIEPLGKWSFLDIFIVIIILVLTDDQLFIAATPVIGLYFFVVAIVLSMIAAMAIERLSRPRPPEDPGRPQSLASKPGRRRWVVGLLLLLSVPALVAAVELPFLKITRFLLSGEAYSIRRSAGTLWSDDAYLLAAIVAVTLIAVPVACVASMVVVWFRGLDRHGRHRWRVRLAAMWQWTMIDVFGLALLAFLTEGDDLIRTEVRQGLYLIVAAAVVLTLTYVLIAGANRHADTRGSTSCDQ